MFIEQAYKGENDWWRVVVTLLASAGVLIWSLVMYFVLTDEELQATYDMMKNFPNNIVLAANLAPFVFMLAILFIAVLFLHRRSILSLTTSRRKIDFGRVAFACGLMVVFTVISFVISYMVDSTEITWNFKPLNFAILFFISALLFPLQVAFEEYLFRGYLMQQVGIVVRNRWFPLLLTSVLFGLFHSANPEVLEMGFGIMAFYIGTGLLLGIITLMDESLELAIGFHLGNNMMAALLVTSEFAALQTDAIFKYSGAGDAGILQEMIITMAVTYPIILLILSWRYRWIDWSSKLFGKVASKRSFLSTTHGNS